MHRAYFNGYALWTYLTTPFLLAMDGVQAEETEPWREGSELWRVMHDYNVNVAGGFGASQLTSDYVVANGVRLPTKRRAYTRGPDRRPILEMLMVAIDIGYVSFT